jgi:hypothetical protein
MLPSSSNFLGSKGMAIEIQGLLEAHEKLIKNEQLLLTP